MFRYTVTKDDFTEMAIYIMKQKSAKLSSKIKLVLFTFVQMGVVAWLIFRQNDASPFIRVLMGIASVIWAFQTVFSFGFYKPRAKMMLANQKDKDPDGDFWKEHRLQLKNEKIDIGYGSQNASLECAEITGVDETGNLTLLMSGKSIFEIVPKRVSEQDSFKAFLNDIRATADRKLKEAQEKQRRKVLDSAVFLKYLPIPEEEVVQRLVTMKRLSYLSPAGWSKVSFFTMLLPLLILAVSIYYKSTLYIILAAVFFFLTNAGTLMIFTPLYKKAVKSRVQPAGEEGYVLAVTEGKIHLFTREYHFKYDLKDLRRVIDRAEASYWFFAGQQMVFVPASVRDEFKKALSRRRSLTSLSHLGSENEGESETEEKPEE